MFISKLHTEKFCSILTGNYTIFFIRIFAFFRSRVAIQLPDVYGWKSTQSVYITHKYIRDDVVKYNENKSNVLVKKCQIWAFVLLTQNACRVRAGNGTTSLRLQRPSGPHWCVMHVQICARGRFWPRTTWQRSILKFKNLVIHEFWYSSCSHKTFMYDVSK
jgi:hypothetical protein